MKLYRYELDEDDIGQQGKVLVGEFASADHVLDYIRLQQANADDLPGVVTHTDGTLDDILWIIGDVF